MDASRGRIAVRWLVATLLAFTVALAHAQDREPYAGKTMEVVIRSKPGGGYDTHGRLIARHIGRHLPGSPNVNAVNMPGGGGIVAANYLARQAKPDGLTIAILARELALGQLVGGTGVQYDVTQLVPIGSTSEESRVLLIDPDLPIDSLEDLKSFERDLVVAVSGPGAGSYQMPALLRADDYPLKIVTGYESTPEQLLAIERGEADAVSGTLESWLPHIEDGSVKVLARLGTQPSDATNVKDHLSREVRQIATLVEASLVPGRPFFAPPGTSEEHVRLLREAFRAALEDRALLDEAEKMEVSVSYLGPEEMAEMYSELLATSPELVQRAEELQILGK
jgi:tripartite-type tricarboxylate transporter receptor subunit TctC